MDGELYLSVEWALGTTTPHFLRIIHCVSLVLLGDPVSFTLDVVLQ